MADKDIREFDVVILGGGFAGVYCGKELAKEVRRNPQFRVALISDENYMVFQPMLPEVAAASISPRHVVNPIRQLCKGINVYKGNVMEVDPAEKTVRISPGDFTPDIRFRYKKLVLALGARIDLSRVPGMSEHSLLMQNVGDAMKLRATVIGRFEEANIVADRDRKRDLLSIVVVGGGYSGVETAGELLDLLTDIHQYYRNIDHDDFKVTLVHSGEHLLPTLSRKLGEYCARELRNRGLELILNQRVKAVTANSVILTDDRRISTNTVVSTVGNAPHPVVLNVMDSLGVESVKGRVETVPFLHLKDNEDIWAVGDCAAVPFADGGYCPPTAQFAQREGTLAGRNIAAAFKGKALQAFDFKGVGELAAIGHRRAVAEIMGFAFSGFIAWWMWRSIYVSKLPGLQRKLRVVLDWTFDLFFARDINLLNPQYSKPLKEIHLEPGDTLFYPGEPAFSIYFVRDGVVEIRDGEDVVKTVRKGEYFGERAILDDQIWRYQATATEPTELIALGAREFKAIVEGSKDLRTLFERSALAYGESEEFAKLQQRLKDSTFTSSVSNLMVKDADILKMDASFTDALRMFRERSHGSYPVLDGEGKFIGVLKRDTLYDAIKSHGLDSGQTIADLPLGSLPVVRPTANGQDLLTRMNRAGKNKIIVCDEEGTFLGLVTVVDILDFGLEAKSSS